MVALDGSKLLVACSGATDVAEVGDRAVRMVQKEGVGKMVCLTGLSAGSPVVKERVKAAAKVVVVDGCEKECAKRCLTAAGIENFAHVRVTDCGMEKGNTVVDESHVAAVAVRVEVALR